MIKYRVLCLMSLALLMILSGCSRSGEITVSEPICLSAMSKAKVMQVAEEVLTSMQFVIDKYDVDAGFLKTMTAMAGIFTGGSTRLQELRVESEEIEWINLGNDAALEARILQRIQKKINKLERGGI